MGFLLEAAFSSLKTTIKVDSIADYLHKFLEQQSDKEVRPHLIWASCPSLKLGISAGIVSIPPGARATQTDIYREADAALYEAKRSKQAFDGKAHVAKRTLELTKRHDISVE